MSDQSKAEGAETPDSFSRVLETELELLSELRAESEESPTDAAASQDTESKNAMSDGKQTVYEEAVASDLAGLAFSGGGIRRATVNHGVIQALADDGALHK